jgi:hypothetical protein
MSAELAGAEAPAPECVQAKFFVTAEADPGLASRLVEPFAKLGLIPARVHMSTEDRTGEEISADLRVADVTPLTAHLIDKALRRIVGVRQVIALVE